MKNCPTRLDCESVANHNLNRLLDEAAARQANRANLPPLLTYCNILLFCNKKKAAMQEHSLSTSIITKRRLQ
jgi:hypothetical protein